MGRAAGSGKSHAAAVLRGDAFARVLRERRGSAPADALDALLPGPGAWVRLRRLLAEVERGRFQPALDALAECRAPDERPRPVLDGLRGTLALLLASTTVRSRADEVAAFFDELQLLELRPPRDDSIPTLAPEDDAALATTMAELIDMRLWVRAQHPRHATVADLREWVPDQFEAAVVEVAVRKAQDDWSGWLNRLLSASDIRRLASRTRRPAHRLRLDDDTLAGMLRTALYEEQGARVGQLTTALREVLDDLAAQH